MLESNPPRNSWLQTHRDDDAGAKPERASSPGFNNNIGLIDLLMP